MFELRTHNPAQELYTSTLQSSWQRDHIEYPSLWLARDPDAEAKMLRNTTIGRVVDYRCGLAAGQDWALIAKDTKNQCHALAVEVGTDLLGHIKKFAAARKLLARACFHGTRYGRVLSVPRTLTLGDGKPRVWRVPVRIEDQDQLRYRKTVDQPYGANPSAKWQRYEIIGGEAGKWVDVSRAEAVTMIRHVYDESEDSLGYGKGLREKLGWPWYALEHTNQEALGAVERFARGWVVGKFDGLRHAVESDTNSTAIRTYTNALKDMQSRHAIAIDKADEIEIREGSGTGWEMIISFRQELKNEIETLVLAANLPTSATEGGSYAMADVQQGSTDALIQFDRDALEETLTDDLLGCVWFQNHANLVELGVQDCMPRFSITKERREDPQVIANVAATLNGMGVDLSADDLYERTGMRKPEPGEDIIPGSTAPAMPEPFGLGVPR